MKLIDSVIKNGYCIGFGVCAVVKGSPLTVEMDSMGRYQAVLHSDAAITADVEEQLEAVCPFSATAANESDLAKRWFPDAPQSNRYLGRFVSAYGGWVSELEFRKQGSSGGFASWILCELLARGYVDYVVNVQPEGFFEGRPLFKFGVSDSVDAIRAGAKSRYYPVTYAEVLEEIRRRPGRVAIIGLPCFIKAIRLLCNVDSEFNEKIAYAVGILCGHLKSARYWELFAWGMGIDPKSVVSFDFRKKVEGVDAHQYGVEVAFRDANGLLHTRTKIAKDVFGTNWGTGLFKYKACDYCDDVFGETADVVIGDAWIPEFDTDWRGANVILVRNPIIDDLVKSGMRARRLDMRKLKPDRVIRSQRGSVRRRREGLAYRLDDARSSGVSYIPPKRVKPCSLLLDKGNRAGFRLREQLRDLSHVAYEKVKTADDYERFKSVMHPLISDYFEHYRPGGRKAFVVIKKFISRVWLKLFCWA